MQTLTRYDDGRCSMSTTDERQLDREAIDAIVARAPKMTPEQADRLRRLLAPGFAAVATETAGRDPDRDSSGNKASPQDGDDQGALLSPRTNDNNDDSPVGEDGHDAR
jgi:hypothetical protein